MEATGHYWLSLYSALIDFGFNVVVINPIQSDAFRKMYIRQTKMILLILLSLLKLCVLVSFLSLLF
nr:IS110 family transposase [Clostridium septicum]